MIDTNGRDFVNDIRNGKQPMLLCTHLQLCHNEILDTTSPIQKEEMHSFLMNNLCGKLGSLKSACEALIEKDSTRLLHILTHEINGNELCHMFGLCPKNSPLLNELALKDDPSKCKRCVKDFTRRKHIAERLVNHSSEFLHHFCEQLPQADDCIKSVDGSINELLTFIRSLDPKNICIQLNMCDQKSLSSIQTMDITPSNNAINEEIIEYIKTDVCVKLGSLSSLEEIIEYIKTDVCVKLGSLSSLCVQLVESEGVNLFNQLSKTIDPHQICSIIDVCPSNLVLQNCHDKCQCCMNKIEIFQKELEKFMRAIVASTRIMCDYVPGRDVCLQLADVFESNVNKAVARFDSKRTCQLLSLCSSSEMKTNEDPCKTCTNELNIRQNRFRETSDEIAADQLSLCKDESCRSRVQSTYQTLSDKMNNFNSPKTCQRIGYCLSDNLHEPSETTLRLKSLVQQQTKTLEERLQSHDICAEFGESKTMCEHIMISANNHRYASVYMALLKNNPKLIDDDLREQMSTNVHADVCQSCKDAVQSSKDFWGNNLEAVRNVLLRTCEYCPSKDECRDYTNQRFDNIKSYLNNIDPTQFCQTMHLCSTSASIHPHPHEPKSVLVNLLPEYENEEINDSNSTCILCEYAMNILSSYIHQKSTEEEIEQDLQKVCQEMPATLRSQCHELIDNYGPSIIAVLIGHFDASTVCQKLNLCTKQMKVELSHITKANQATCGVCDYVSTYMNFVLKRDPSEKSVEHALSTVCSHLSNEQSPQCETLEEIIEYIKTDVCVKLGSLSSLCVQLVDSEGLNLFNQLSKTMDPHQICSIIDVCPSNLVLQNCHDKCQCCMNKIEIYQKELEKFMRAIVASTRIMCDYVPGRDVCLQLADVFESNVNKAVARFDSKRTCQLLSLCSSSEMKTNEDPCKTCTNELNIRQNRFRETIDEIAADQLSLCKDESCRSRVQSTYQTLTDKMNNFNSPKTCQRIGYCLSNNLHEPSETTLRLKSLVQQQTKTLEERLQSHDICAEFGESKTMCEHIMISVNNHRYAYIYMSLLKNNPKLIDDDLREQMSTDVHADVCQSCKDAVQSSKDFWNNNLEAVRNVLLRTCERCTVKDQCRDYYNQKFDNLKAYINNIDAAQFCQTIHLCSTSHVTIETDKCSTCVESLQQRKDGMLHGITRVASYFDDLCQRFG
ncbi:unnamed protein product, partial [Adineta steineri]